jgi:heme-degrading monooxygenase HmoA
MYIVMNRIPVNKDYWSDFEQRFLQRQGFVDQSPGFIRNLVLRPDDDSSEYHVVMTLWQTHKDFIDWTESDSFRQAHAQARETPKEMYAGRNVLEMFTVISDSGDLQGRD